VKLSQGDKKNIRSIKSQAGMPVIFYFGKVDVKQPRFRAMLKEMKAELLCAAVPEGKEGKHWMYLIFRRA
jgi:hypothetical protein